MLLYLIMSLGEVTQGHLSYVSTEDEWNQTFPSRWKKETFMWYQRGLQNFCFLQKLGDRILAY